MIFDFIKNYFILKDIEKETGIKYEKVEDINWEFVSRYQILSEKFIRKYKNELLWNCISQYQNLSECLIEEFKDRVNWMKINRYQRLSKSFIDKYKDSKISWYNLSSNKYLTEDIIDAYVDKLNWCSLSSDLVLSEQFIEKYKDEVDWENISAYQKLSESFIEKWENRVSWWYISRYQVLSEKFIEKYQDIVDWDYISGYQRLSKNFVKKYFDKIRISFLEQNIKYKTDIGKDWFIAYLDKRVYEYIVKDSRSFRIDNIISGRFNPNVTYYKLQIYYKDISSNTVITKFKILRTIYKYKKQKKL